MIVVIVFVEVLGFPPLRQEKLARMGHGAFFLDLQGSFSEA